MSKKEALITRENLLSRLSYNQATGEFVWEKARNKTQIGATAGSLANTGYLVVNFGRNFGPICLHRLAWLHVYGIHPVGVIDHINGDKLDNRISNLRLVDNFINQQNRRGCNKNNKSGLLGVHRHQSKFRSRVMANGKTHDLGVFDTPEAANAAYLERKRMMNIGVHQ